MSAPEISVVVPSHGRALRLRWLLDALQGQTLDPARWELIVVHDNPDDEPTEELLRRHPLAESVLRHHRLAPGTGSPARQRNAGWRDARAPVVAFTDDDCRPEPRWLERMLAAAVASPGAIVQGATRPDPLDADVAKAARVRTLSVDPPVRTCPTCNIAYPRAELERVGGFDETFPGPAGEDTDLAMRVGAPIAPAPDAVVLHAVEAFGWVAWVRMLWKWRHLPLVVKRHPQLREGMALRVFWKDSHWRFLLAFVGVAVARRWAPAVLLVLPYLRGGLAHLPSRVVTDAVEIAAVAGGSARYRTLLL